MDSRIQLLIVADRIERDLAAAQDEHRAAFAHQAATARSHARFRRARRAHVPAPRGLPARHDVSHTSGA